MEPQKDYAGKNTYKKTTRNNIDIISDEPRNASLTNCGVAKLISPSQSQSQSQSDNIDDVFSKKNVIAYYILMLFTVGGISKGNSILSDIFLSFCAVLISILVGVIIMLPLLFSLELLGFGYLASKVKDKSDILIPILGYAFMFSIMYGDIVFRR